MGLVSKAPVSREDGVLVSENAASHLLKLAAQMALEVTLTIKNSAPVAGLMILDQLSTCRSFKRVHSCE